MPADRWAGLHGRSVVADPRAEIRDRP